MRKLLLVLPAIIIVSLAVLRVVPLRNGEPEVRVTQDIRNNPMSREVRAELVEAFGPDALDIVVGVDGKVAVLSGSVHERATQKLAEHVASAVDGILVVHNFLELDSQPGLVATDLAARDKKLKKKVSSELAGSISVDACDGVVLLRGQLPDSDHHDEAVRVTENLPDVRKVIDLLHVTWSSSMPGLSTVAMTSDLMLPAGMEK